MIIGGETNISSLGLFFILTMGILSFFLPRRLVFIPIIMTACYISMGQMLTIFSFHFTVMRIIIFFIWIRLIARGEIKALKLNSIDHAFICWIVISSIFNTLLWQNVGAFQYCLGRLYNAVGLYFPFRILIRDISETEYAIKISAIIILPLSIFMIIESFSGINCFSIFGGVPEISWVRDGHVRAQGAFRYAGTAGAVGATLLPFFIPLWFREKDKFYSIIGTASATIITITSHSGGPFLSYVAAIIGLMMWPFHNHMRKVRLAIFFTLTLLHIFMKAPIWFLIARMSSLVKGDAYHRSAIIDAAVKHFNEWWLMGTKSTAHWMPYSLIDASGKVFADVTNQYIKEGVFGGLISMLLFIYIIKLCFREIGISLRLNRNQPLYVRILLWSVGVSLFVHVINYFSVSYFDQIIVFWYLSLALISSVCIQRLQNENINE